MKDRSQERTLITILVCAAVGGHAAAAAEATAEKAALTGDAQPKRQAASDSPFVKALQAHPYFPANRCGLRLSFINDIDMKRVAEKFSIKGLLTTSNDFARVLAIMDWVNRRTTHGGLGYVPDGKHNLVDSLDHARTNQVCCFDQSVMMAEFCLGCGYQARFIRCKPMDERDRDCHVVVHVLIPSLNKWVLMDPTFNAYYIDENNRPLSIPELRDALKTGKRVTVSAGARYNQQKAGDSEQFTKDRLNYMAKNVFWFDSLDVSCRGSFDKYMNGDGSVKYIFLCPEGFDARTFMLNNHAFRVESIKKMDIDATQREELSELVEKWTPVIQRMAKEGIQCGSDEFWGVPQTPALAADRNVLAPGLRRMPE